VGSSTTASPLVEALRTGAPNDESPAYTRVLRLASIDLSSAALFELEESG